MYVHMELEKKLGPIKIRYTDSLINRKQQIVTVAIGFTTYLILFYGIFGVYSLKNMAISMVAGIIVTLVLKRYYEYKNASQNRQTLENRF